MSFSTIDFVSPGIKRRLLCGASAGVMALVIGMALPTGALADTEEVSGTTAVPGFTAGTGGNGVINAGDAIANDVNTNGGGDAGAIDTNGGLTLDSISLSRDTTLFVFDSVTGGDDLDVTNSFLITDGSAIVNLSLAQSNDSNGSDGADVDITGDLAGGTSPLLRGGHLNITVGAGRAAEGNSSFTTLGSTNLTSITASAGDADAWSSGSNLSLNFGDAGENDTFELTTLTLTGGDASGAGDGGEVNFAARGTGSALINGDLTVTGGANAGGNSGGSVSAQFSHSFATEVTGTLRVGGADTGFATASFASGTVTVGSAVLDANGQIALNSASLQTFNGDITTLSNGDGFLFINKVGDAGAIFTGNVGTDTHRLASIQTAEAGQLRFQGNVFTDALVIGSGETVLFEGTTVGLRNISGAGSFTVGGVGTTTTATITNNINNNSESFIDDGGVLIIDNSAGSTIDVGPAISALSTNSTLRTIGDPTSGNIDDVDFTSAVGLGGTAIGSVILGEDTRFRAGLGAVDVDVAANVLAVLDADSTVTGNLTGAGTVSIESGQSLTLGANGQTSTVSVASIDGPGSVRIADGSIMTFSAIVNDGGLGTPATVFASTGANTVLTINTDRPGAAAISADQVTLNESLIKLGNAFGDGDTVFATDSLVVGTSSAGDTAVELSAAFAEGTITFVDSIVDESGDVADFVATDTALTDFTIQSNATDNTIIEIVATAKSDAAAAAELGISEAEVQALREAIEGASGAGDSESVQAISDLLNEDNDEAVGTASQSFGTQGDGLAGGAGAAFASSGEQQRVLSGILGRVTSGFDSAGFSGGDLAGPAGAPEPLASFWFQGFGGLADADGNSVVAGYDASFAGVMFGVDGEVADGLTLGAFGSYSFSSVDGDGSGDVEIDSNAYGLGIYAGYTAPSFYLDAFASYTFSDNDMTRTAVIANVTRNLAATYDASLWSVGVSGGVPLEVSSNVFVTPNASLTLNSYDADSYTETGTGFSQTVNPDTVTALTGTVGARVHAVYEQADGTQFVPELRVGLIADLSDDDAAAQVAFTGGGTTYQVAGTDTADIGAQIGVGAAFSNDNWAVGLSYDAEIRSDYLSHTGRAEVRWKF